MSTKDQLYLAGERASGQDVRTQNVTAALSVANVVKSSLGPIGLDKMLVDDLGEVTITNDGATILNQLEVEHPAARVLVQLSEMQDKEVGDGTTSVVILAAELLKRANELVKNSIHPTSVMSGYRMAMKESIKFIKDQLAVKTDKMGREVAFSVAKTTLSSKIFGRESEFFAQASRPPAPRAPPVARPSPPPRRPHPLPPPRAPPLTTPPCLCASPSRASSSSSCVQMAVDAMMMVKEDNAETGKTHYPVRSVAIMKQHGGSAKDSTLMNGYVLYGGRAAQGMPRTVKNAKIALLDIDLRKTKMAMGVQVVVTDPKKLEDIRQRESDITKVPQRPAPPARHPARRRRLPLAAAAPSPRSPHLPPLPPSRRSASRRSSRRAQSSSPPRGSTTWRSSTLSRRGRSPSAASRRRTSAASPRCANSARNSARIPRNFRRLPRRPPLSSPAAR